MKQATKRVLSIVLIICILTAGTSAFAAVEWTHIDALGAALTIGAQGYATCSSTLEISNSTDTGNLYMYLQRYVNGSWTNVNSWSDTGTEDLGISANYYVSSGYYYRVHVIAYIFTSGTLVETATQDSSSVYY